MVLKNGNCSAETVANGYSRDTTLISIRLLNQSDGVYMKLLKVAAIAAIVFSGSALAGVVPQYGGGGNHGGGGNNSGPNLS